MAIAAFGLLTVNYALALNSDEWTGNTHSPWVLTALDAEFQSASGMLLLKEFQQGQTRMHWYCLRFCPIEGLDDYLELEDVIYVPWIGPPELVYVIRHRDGFRPWKGSLERGKGGGCIARCRIGLVPYCGRLTSVKFPSVDSCTTPSQPSFRIYRCLLKCVHIPDLNALVLSISMLPGSSSGAITERSSCLLLKEKLERSMPFVFGAAVTDIVMSSPVKGAARAKFLDVKSMV